MEYGRFYPVAKAMEPLGEKWTMLILRKKIPGQHGNEYFLTRAGKRLKLVGPSALMRNIRHWIPDSIFAGIPPAREI